jgi:hypothetical protein
MSVLRIRGAAVSRRSTTARGPAGNRRPAARVPVGAGRGAFLVRIATVACAMAGSLAFGLAPAEAQVVDTRAGVFVNSEMDYYLRLLQGRGLVTPYPWSIRGFSVDQAERLVPADTAPHPWAQSLVRSGVEAAEPRFSLLAPRARAIFNSAFPYAEHSGPIWAGRGLTTAVSAGFAMRAGPLSIVVAPEFFYTQNAEFPLEPTTYDRSHFQDGRFPVHFIDLPQRFGEGPVSRVDAGQSAARLDLLGASVGVSTANQHWGPARSFPLILGNDAPGFVHAFAGTTDPVDLWIGSLHGRVSWGRLEESAYSPAPDSLSTRFMGGLVLTFTPRGVPGLELGGARFFHLRWLDGSPRLWQITKPFDAILASGTVNPTAGDGIDNQLASAFFRWVLPRSGFEVYGEFAREDFNSDLRDLLLQPDHDSAYLLGFAKSWKGTGATLRSLRGEVMNAQMTHLEFARVQVPFYVHSHLRQGHTHRGQILGAPAAFGGAGATLALDSYHPGGRWSMSWQRELRHYRGGHWGGGKIDLAAHDVVHSLGGDLLVFRGRWAIQAGLRGLYNLDRGFSEDVFNLHATFGISTHSR